jgi:type IV secretory pathway TraG/TraD family ATPase VirD4
MFNLEELAQKWDVQWGFTRPANEQHLSSYKTFLRLSQDWAATITFGVCSLLAAIFWLDALYGLWTMEVLPNPILFLPLVVVGIILIVLAFFADYSTVWLAYRKEFQSESYGSSVWADVAHLKAKKLLAPVGTEPENAVPITRFQRNWWLAFPLHIFAQHVCLIAPPGAGKTSTIVMNVVRWFSGFGGAVILDPKGEIHKHTAHYMSEVMRFDLDKSELTDFFDLFGACRRNPTLAGKIAFTLIHQPEGGGKDPIWEQSATSMLKCLILHLCELIEYPTPQSIFTFLDANPAKAKKRFNPATGKDETYYPLHEAMANSPSQEAKEIWGANFSQLSKDTFTSVIFTVLSRLDVFTDPKVQNALRPPTELELRHGRRKIDFTVLRKMSEKIKGKKRGAGIYCVIPMGEAERLKKVVGCFFAVASNVLRETGGDDQKVYSMLMLDEIGNIPIPGLQELVNLGRGLKICVFYELSIQVPTGTALRGCRRQSYSRIGRNLNLPAGHQRR